MLVAMETGQGAGLSTPAHKEGDLQALLQELCHLQAKNKKLKREVEKHKLFEDYLIKVLEKILKEWGPAKADATVVERAQVPGPNPSATVAKRVASGKFSRLQRTGGAGGGPCGGQDVQKHLAAFSQMNLAVLQSLESLEESHRALVPVTVA
ncbi:PREDICTED: uncharacterized protein encoded LINC00521-like [Galeopterus variegatus]|uniref:Uncharacterized protein encoded LINC00521-like n=1 Tax=Galeopterus variegatus TaxID=482537 RepID=A0ABM0RXE1_GALVR|nr:PREDICTED: uncharacterized protein encoded LINC00521-like [Galeopterus variegatus]